MSNSTVVVTSLWVWDLAGTLWLIMRLYAGTESVFDETDNELYSVK